MKEILLCIAPGETRLAVTANGKLFDYATEREGEESLVGRVYKGTVKNVVPSVKGRFIDIGIGQNAFLRDSDALAVSSHYPTAGASVLVQVVKDATETKGPLVTMKISFPGHLCVLLTESDYIGVSRKIREDETRVALRKTAKESLPKGIGIILRTQAGNAAKEDVEKEIERLSHLWETVQKRAKMQKKPGLLYRDHELSVRLLREFYSVDLKTIRVNDEETAKRLSDMAQDEGNTDFSISYESGNLFAKYGIEEDIENLYRKTVELLGGGSIVIEPTEALTAIDVNSGGFLSPDIPHEETAYLVNLRAAEEIARQIKMRGIGGMILIDFIDMETDAHKEAVVALLRKAVAADRLKTVVLGMTKLGLVEMTRKRGERTLWQKECEPCPYCKGEGHIPTVSSVVRQIHRALLEEKGKNANPICIECAPEVAGRLAEPDEIFLMKSISYRPVSVLAKENWHREKWCFTQGREPE